MSTWSAITWDVARAGGFTAFLLLTLSVALGLALSLQLQAPRWPRLINNELHNFVTVVTLVFIGVHVLAVWLDPFTQFGLDEILAALRQPLSPDLDGTGHRRGVSGAGHRAERLHPPTHRLRLVAAAALPDLRGLRAHPGSWHRHRQRHTHMVGHHDLWRERAADDGAALAASRTSRHSRRPGASRARQFHAGDGVYFVHLGAARPAAVELERQRQQRQWLRPALLVAGRAYS